METLFTVLITLGVVSFIGIIVGVIGLMRRVKKLEQVREDMRYMEESLHQEIKKESRNRDEYIAHAESSLDRRFDNVWHDIHQLKES